MSEPRPQRILLVGFMGSGKTTVGTDLAARLGWRFADADDVLVEDERLSIPEIFARHGEHYFRAAEKGTMERLLSDREVVIASGGGWAATRGRLESVPANTATVWLQVGAEEAVRRAGAQEGSRPLMTGPDALEAARELLQERTPKYARAGSEVDTEGLSVEDVSIRILESLGMNER